MPAKRRNSNSPSESKSESKLADNKRQKNKVFENISSINNWFINPLIHPNTRIEFTLYSDDYINLYESAFDFLDIYFKDNYDFTKKTEQYQFINLINKYLPKNHVLFKFLDIELSKDFRNDIIDYGIDYLFYKNMIKLINKYSFSILNDYVIIKNICLYNQIIVNNTAKTEDNIDYDIKKAELKLLEKLHSSINLDIVIKCKEAYIYNLIFSIFNIGYIPQLKSFNDITFEEYYNYCNNNNNDILSIFFTVYKNFLEQYYIIYTSIENETEIVSIDAYILSMIQDEKEFLTNEYKLNESWI